MTTIPLPSVVQQGRVYGSLYVISVDTVADSDTDPDFARVAGAGVLTPTISMIRWPSDGAGSGPFTTFLVPIPFNLLADGTVVTPGGDPLWVPCNHQPNSSLVKDFGWNATLTLSGSGVAQPVKFGLTVVEGEFGADLSNQLPIIGAGPSSGVAVGPRGPAGPQGPPGSGGGGVSNIGLDTDGVPYYSVGANAASIQTDTDGVPYFEAA